MRGERIAGTRYAARTCSALNRPADPRQAARDDARVDGRAAELGDEDVAVLLAEELVAGLGVETKRDLVRHRRRRQEDRLVLPEQPRRTLLQLVDVGSSRFCSSPTTAAAIAARIPAVGRVAVSERRSITGEKLP